MILPQRQQMHRRIWMMITIGTCAYSDCAETLLALTKSLTQIGAPQDISQELTRALVLFEKLKKDTLDEAEKGNENAESVNDYGKLLLEAFKPVTRLHEKHIPAIQKAFEPGSRYDQQSNKLGKQLLQKVHGLKKDVGRIVARNQHEAEELEKGT